MPWLKTVITQTLVFCPSAYDMGAGLAVCLREACTGRLFGAGCARLLGSCSRLAAVVGAPALALAL